MSSKPSLHLGQVCVMESVFRLLQVSIKGKIEQRYALNVLGSRWWL